MPLQTTDDDKLNPGQANYDAKVNNVGKREQAGTFDTVSKNYNKTADDTQENRNIAKAKALENTPSANWTNKVVGGIANASGLKTKKSNNPLIAILIIIFGGGASFAGLFGAMSLLPLDVVAQFIKKEDSQNTSFTIRTDKIINAKISQSTTSGLCNPNLPKLSLLCKYERPSNKLLNALDKQGISALDKAGVVIKGTGLFPNARPDHYSFKGETITAKDFSTKLTNDAEFRAAFHNAYTPRFVAFADNIFKAIKDKFHFTLTDKLKGAKDTKTATTALEENSKGPETGAKAAAGDIVAEENIVKEELTAQMEKETKNIAHAGKGNAIALAASVVCAAGDIPSLIINAVRAYQLVQLIDYAATIVTTVNAWKAGDAQPQEITALGDMLTVAVAGKSAMDSFGIKNILFGDTTTTDTSWKQFSPGASVIDNPSIGGVSQFTSSDIKKGICNVATNPVTGFVADAVTSETIVGPLLNIGIGIALSTVLDQIGPSIIHGVFALLPTNIFQPLISFFLGDLAKGRVGIEAGNLLSSGIVHLLGQTANKGGNMPLTVAQKLAYDNTTAQVNLAYAQEDRATHSPFDASNPNTLLGSFVSNLLPYYGNMGSVAGVFSSLGSIITGSIGTIIGQPAANAVSANGAQYKLCDDPAITGFGKDVAAGPFCNIEYGIPPEYLGLDPQTVANDLAKQIDSTTGEPNPAPNPPISILDATTEAKGSLSGWMALCTDGGSDHASDCKITDKTTAEYAIYTIDHRVQTTMDGEDAALDPSTTTAAQSALVPITNRTPDLAVAITTAVNTNLAQITTNTATSVSNFSAVLLNSTVTSNRPAHSFIPSNPLAYIIVPKKSVGITL
jgi:hypothetical protein